MSEVEIKLLLDEASAKTLWAKARSARLVKARPAVRMLRSIYWDTGGYALRNAGIALRLRRDGRRWLQTVKCDRRLELGLSIANEMETPAPGGRLRIDAIPDEPVRNRIAEIIKDSALEPVCETVIRRTAGEVVCPDGTLAELAVDVGRILAGGRAAEFREAEIELIEGDPAGLFDVARLLMPDGGFRFSRLSKSARGYLLAEKGVIEPPVAPRTARSTAVAGEQTVEQAASMVLHECLEQVADNVVATLDLDDPEGAHQLRVGLRRLRSAFSTFAPALGGPAMTALSEEARWLGQEVGRLRDLDVATIDILRPEAAAHPEEQGLLRLAEAIEAEAAACRAEVRGVLAGTRTQCFLIDLARFVATRGWLDRSDLEQSARLAQPAAEFAAEALARRWKKARKRARDIEGLSPEERHELRKELKKLRYAVEFFAPLYARKKVAPFLSCLKRMQDVFGAANDAATIKATFDGSTERAALDPRAAGWVVGAWQARAVHDWSGAGKLWSELKEARRFWM